MKVHEYQGKELFRKYQIPTPNGVPVFSVEEALKAYDELATDTVVVKAQIHAGGRGKGGGVKLAHSKEEVESLSKEILGMTLVTHQTGPDGKEVQRLLIESGANIEKEFYAAITLDRGKEMDVFMVSLEGGVDIEKVAAETPEKIVKTWIDPMLGMNSYQARKLAFGLNLKGSAFKEACSIFMKMYNCYRLTDASLLEVNPLVLTKDERVIALDSKFNFDGNALFRQNEIAEMRDLTEEDSMEVEAGKYNLNYIKLDGNVGCMVNGAGLAMATMDIIKLYGKEPANFLDVGGGATKEQVMNAFKIILSDKNVKGILVNIFGGIMRCEIIAQGIIETASELNLSIPLVVRLEGTNVDLGKKYLEESGLNIIPANDLDEAAKKIVDAVSKE